MPLKGTVTVTATFGQQGSYWAKGHQGIDLYAEDRRIFAPIDGVVRVIAYDENGWGQYLSLGDGEGRRHLFCHLERGSIPVKTGQRVTAGTLLGRMGATGNVTGVHLHYQLQLGEQVIDPTPFLGIPNRVGSYREEELMIYRDEADIPAWALEAVKLAQERGWMLGDDDGRFRPNDPITRAELAVILSRLEK